ncbi:hypothetical protein TSAR_007229 [Trichomalopsis sarcophagae]|uniref:Mutator-like transposase domain-containing protein n=1 Tax=Trichomalopsis sarcophagae TaxID=543379 RepID=A0A232EJS1_9HYME|nr:hypothetical protein TSAR_007229 [Trichomalopsis sarcophagae]
MCDKPQNKFFWKGKRVTEKVYNARVRLASAEKNYETQSRLEESKGQSGEQSNLENGKKEPKLEGRIIVQIKTLATQMDCRKCNQTLSLRDITIQCQHCLCTTGVATDKKNRVTKQGKRIQRYGVNIAGTMATLNTGTGNTHLNKFLSSFKIPIFHPNAYKTHKKEVGIAAEEMARDACTEATLLERELTIKNVTEIQKLFCIVINLFRIKLCVLRIISTDTSCFLPFRPENLQSNFIFPSICDIDHAKVTNVSEDIIVRIAATYDMGWPRGTGREYDSLSGPAALIGYFSKKVLSQMTHI